MKEWVGFGESIARRWNEQDDMARMTRWIAELSMKWEGVGKTETTEGDMVRE
jgi:hypothetical protein